MARELAGRREPAARPLQATRFEPARLFAQARKQFLALPAWYMSCVHCCGGQPKRKTSLALGGEGRPAHARERVEPQDYFGLELSLWRHAHRGRRGMRGYEHVHSSVVLVAAVPVADAARAMSSSASGAGRGAPLTPVALTPTKMRAAGVQAGSRTFSFLFCKQTCGPLNTHSQPHSIRTSYTSQDCSGPPALSRESSTLSDLQSQSGVPDPRGEPRRRPTPPCWNPPRAGTDVVVEAAAPIADCNVGFQAGRTVKTQYS